jgi:heavy metal sensor kinase
METLLVEGRSYRVATHPRRDQWGGPVVMYAQALMALDDLHAREQRLRTWLFAGGLVMLSSGAAASWALSRLWLRSVTVMEETARNLGAGDLGRRRLFVPSDDAELAALAGAFNNLLDRLEVAHTAQQRFTADASHELRTPLTILRGEIEVALRRPRSAEEYRDVLLSNKEEIERLSRLTENMLALAHVDVGDAVAQREPVNMAEVCSVVTAKLQPLAAEKGIALTLDAPDDGGALSVMGDRVALERVMHNLVENAIRYTPPDESVNVRLSKQDAQVRVDVSDSGSGIAPEHLPLLFDRFYRVDKARSRAHGGSGLGLSIVRALVEAHGGTVQVESQVGSGSTFTVRLPAAV